MSTTRKRKSDAGATASSSKKARGKDTHSGAIALVTGILADPTGYAIPEDDDAIRSIFVELAEYARALENQAVSGSSAATQKTEEQIADEAEKLRAMIMNAADVVHEDQKLPLLIGGSDLGAVTAKIAHEFLPLGRIFICE